ncbi:MAG: FHA domain-containing protein [Alphaproteobacteria bacterium]|nr:FHA domain-containing protein [Alphaproteobacteria bacterium]
MRTSRFILAVLSALLTTAAPALAAYGFASDAPGEPWHRNPIVWLVGAVIVGLLIANLVFMSRRRPPEPPPPPAPQQAGRRPIVWSDPSGGGLRGAVLHGFDSQNRKVRFEFSADELKSGVLVGRGRDARAVLNDERVNRAHAMLRLVGDHLEVQSLGGTNPTWVNGVQLQGKQAVNAQFGDKVKFGPVELSLSKL